MTKDQPIAIKDAVQKLQLSLLEGVKDQNQLFAAGYLMACRDYEDVVTERTIANLCGYPLCKNALPLAPSRRGRYRISLKEHKVFDLQETSKFCSSDCLINSRSFMGTLQEERCSVLDTVKLNQVLSLFHDSSVLDSFGLDDELGISRLRIHENEEPKTGEVSLEEWMGPSDAIEGYVPKNVSKPKNVGKPKASRSKKFEQVSRTPPPHATKATKSLKSEQPHGGEGSDNLKKGAVVSRSSFGSSENYLGSVTSDKPSITNSIFNEMDFFSTVITSDEYSVSKLPPYSMGSTFKEELVDIEGSKRFSDVEQQTFVSGSSSSSFKKPSRKKSEDAKGKDKMVEEDKSNTQEVSPTLFHGDTTTEAAESDKKSHAENPCLLNGSSLKPSLKSSRAKKLGRSVTWADENAASCGSSNLCEFRVIEDTKTLPETSCKKDDGDRTIRYASAEACAAALSQAAEAVESQHLDVSDAVYEAGIVILPTAHQGSEEECTEDVEEEALESEPTLKWPTKPGLPDSDVFDPDRSWFDKAPEGFSLTLSNFATLWNAIFGWVTSSSLAYVYGKDEAFHEEYLFINGREYPRKIVLEDGRSSEIKETLAGYLSRALPGLITDLRLPVPTSELEKGLACLLDTMSCVEAIPAFRMKQWKVIILLFLEALSIARIPAVATYINNRRMLLHVVLDGAEIDMEEYEMMRDILMPLGRIPQFSSQSGA